MKRLIANGDSWTYGSELINPELGKDYDPESHAYYLLDLDPRNNNYRLTNAYPWHIGQHYGAEVINLGLLADNNNFIAERTIDYIIEKDLWGPDNFVIVGWTAPERNDFYMNIPSDPPVFRQRIFNKLIDDLIYPPARQFVEFYLLHMIIPEEYWTRYVKNVALLENFLKVRDIPYLMFNAFYTGRDMTKAEDWRDLHDVNIRADIDTCKRLGKLVAEGLEVSDTDHDIARNLWKTVDPVRWYNKDQFKNSFRSAVATRLDNPFARSNRGHPNEEAHKLWAQILIGYIKDHQLTLPPSQK